MVIIKSFLIYCFRAPSYDIHGRISDEDIGVDYRDKDFSFGVRHGSYVLTPGFYKTRNRPRFKKTLRQALIEAEDRINSLYGKGFRS